MKTTRILAAAAALALSACTSIPKQNLDSYVTNFNTAKSTAQDLYLTAQVQAEKAGTDSRVDRLQRSERVAATQARIAALDVIDQYNKVLVKLATGTDPGAIKADLEGFSSNLSSFGINQLTALVKDVAPFIGIISQAVALIDDAIKAERFGDAVAAGQKPIKEVLAILRLDADNLHGIQSHVLQIPFDQDLGSYTALLARARLFVNDLNADDRVGGLVAGFNATQAGLNVDSRHKPGPIVHTPVAKPAVPKPDAPPRAAKADDLALLQALLSESNALAQRINQAVALITAHRKLIDEYKQVLTACNTSFEELNTAVKNSSRVGTLAFAVNVMNLRKAFIEVREAR